MEEAEEGQPTAVEIVVELEEEAHSVELSVPADSFRDVAERAGAGFVMTTNMGSVTFDEAATNIHRRPGSVR
jgi:hypothetical protein